MPTLGSEGSIVQVPVGYWRNYLQPNNFAKIATQDILK
jgi:ribosomal protein L9